MSQLDNKYDITHRVFDYCYILQHCKNILCPKVALCITLESDKNNLCWHIFSSLF